MPHGRQYLLQASSEPDLDQWISRINYASTFKTAGVRMRGMGMTGNQAQLAGAAAAASHVKALRAEDQMGNNSASRSGSIVSSGQFDKPELSCRPFAWECMYIELELCVGQGCMTTFCAVTDLHLIQNDSLNLEMLLSP